MKIKIKEMFPKCVVLLGLSLGSLSAVAQTETTLDERPASGAWEIGIGGTAVNWSRVSLSNFQKQDKGYLLSLDAKHLLGGLQVYVAREVTPWLYLDLQGSMNVAKVEGKPYVWNIFSDHYSQLYMGGLGAQFRLTPWLQTPYLEPYLRVGINYLHRNFNSPFSGGFEGDHTNSAHWNAYDTWNQGAKGDARNSFPASVGVGVKGWFSDHFGIGLQGEYLMPIDRHSPNFAQVTASLIWRIGGKSKKPTPQISYIELPAKEVEKIVEKVVEKKVYVTDERYTNIYELLNGIYFDFDRDVLTATSMETLDKMAQIMKEDRGGHYLIMGMTDAKGSRSYNAKLSRRRAKAVYDALLERGIERTRLKYTGVGEGASIVGTRTNHATREGDRKVLIERVCNMKYWDMIK